MRLHVDRVVVHGVSEVPDVDGLRAGVQAQVAAALAGRGGADAAPAAQVARVVASAPADAVPAAEIARAISSALGSGR